MKKSNWSHIQRCKGHKSGLETKIDEQLKSQGIDVLLESLIPKFWELTLLTAPLWSLSLAMYSLSGSLAAIAFTGAMAIPILGALTAMAPALEMLGIGSAGRIKKP